MARFYRFITQNIKFNPAEWKAGKPLTLNEKDEPEIYAQLSRVLRAKAGERIILQPFSERPPVIAYEFVIREIGKRELKLEFAAAAENGNELKIAVQLVLCIPNRPDKLDFIVQKAVELGAAGITLAEGDYSQFRHQLKTERLEKIMREAAEQSERAVVPSLTAGGKLQNFLRALEPGQSGNFYVALERETAAGLPDLLPEMRNKKEISLLVGPEGGFSQEEIGLIRELGLKNFSLGKRILRMETAAIVSLGMIAAALE